MSIEMKPEQGLDLLHDIALAMVRETKPEGMADFTHRQLAILLTVYLERPPHTVRGLAAKLNVSRFRALVTFRPARSWAALGLKHCVQVGTLVMRTTGGQNFRAYVLANTRRW